MDSVIHHLSNWGLQALDRHPELTFRFSNYYEAMDY